MVYEGQDQCLLDVRNRSLVLNLHLVKSGYSVDSS